MGWMRKDKKPVKKVVKKKVVVPKVEEPVEPEQETEDEELEEGEEETSDEEILDEKVEKPVPQEQASGDWEAIKIATQTEEVIYDQKNNRQLTLHQAIAELLNRTE